MQYNVGISYDRSWIIVDILTDLTVEVKHSSLKYMYTGTMKCLNNKEIGVVHGFPMVFPWFSMPFPDFFRQTPENPWVYRIFHGFSIVFQPKTALKTRIFMNCP